ncbi:hypothetical protein BD309DRAFT_963243 [Dichomitus squalens]|nr:hypothetical protein BD309DRAFT_963243 [Dichomitus squalens]
MVARHWWCVCAVASGSVLGFRSHVTTRGSTDIARYCLMFAIEVKLQRGHNQHYHPKRQGDCRFQPVASHIKRRAQSNTGHIHASGLHYIQSTSTVRYYRRAGIQVTHITLHCNL